ncbi:ATP binding protein [Dorcoceras hygrometricum]|uniref:DNA mismatch repair protein n=1 Tax=Dorcoceras hygrometricum TaxID=472368 RepID=A0A2Z7A196_9LAMI|nr:ATP binding protein [Dorcoceras hygrometricum]
MQLCRKPSSVMLVKRVTYSNLLGVDTGLKNGSLKEGTLNWEMLQFKSRFPREVLLCRVGEFYEAIGIDACILVEYAGLNPFGGIRSDSIPRAGCPAVNLRQTLDDLTRNGFSVCIVEEVQGPTHARSRKSRFISGHAHPGSPYVFGLVGDDHDLDFPDPMPVIGISRSAKGYCMVSVLETMKTYSAVDGLTEEALVTKLRTCRCHHLFLHTSLRHNSSGTCRWGEFGEGGLLWGECSARQFDWLEGNPVNELLFKVKELYGLEDDISFRNVTVASDNRPCPLHLGTATQIGALPTEGIPCLLKVLLPSNCTGLPAMYIRDLLLNPPAYDIASTIQEACRLMSNITCSIPEFTCIPSAKLVKLLELRETNHIEFCKIKSVLDDILLLHTNSELREVIKLLMDPAWVATGLKVELEMLASENTTIGPTLPIRNKREGNQAKMTITSSEAKFDALKRSLIESRENVNTLQEIMKAMTESLGKVSRSLSEMKSLIEEMRREEAGERSKTEEEYVAEGGEERITDAPGDECNDVEKQGEADKQDEDATDTSGTADGVIVGTLLVIIVGWSDSSGARMGGAGGAAIAIGVNVRDRFQGVKSRTPNWNWKRCAEELIHRYSGRKAAKPYESDASLKWGKLPVDQHIEEDLLLLLLLIMSYTAKKGCRIPHLLGRKEDVPGPTHKPVQIQQISRKAVVSTSNNRGMGDRAGVERGGGNRFKERKIQSHQEYLVRKVVIEQSWGGHKITKDGEQLGKETKITLFLKEDPLEYLEERNTKDLVKKHSEFISYPIYLWTGKTTEKEFSDEEDDEIEKEEEGDIEEVDEEKEKDKGEKKKIKEVAQEWQIINKQKPIGLRKPEEITKEEYATCYKSPTINWEYRLTVEHFSVEDQLEFKAIYYITGESKKAGENYPSLERLKKKESELQLLHLEDRRERSYILVSMRQFGLRESVSSHLFGLVRLEKNKSNSLDLLWIRKARKLGEEWFTSKKVRGALTRYHEAGNKAKAKVLELLRGLSAELQIKINILVFASMLLVIGKALFCHVSEGRRRKWIFPTITQHHKSEDAGRLCGADGMQITGLWPYWFDAAQGGAVKNTVDMRSLFLLTGPNGGGKSSLLRSICAAALLGICGFMVPAESAIIPHFDSIMLHMKSYDSPADGKSSFQIEMSEIRSIITGATSNSLVLIDEICRGTETAKGTCIAGSIIETLDAIGSLGIVSTHLHGIFDLPLRMKNAVFKAMGTECIDNRIMPTWRLIDGICKESLAFETAQREGVPDALIQRANELYASVYSKDKITKIDSKLKQYDCLDVHEFRGVADRPSRLGKELSPMNQSQKSFDIMSKEVENAVVDICGKSMNDINMKKDSYEPQAMRCVLIGAREQPPPSTIGASSVYVMLRPDRKIYVGETDDLEGRVRAHRLKEGMQNASFLYFLVPGKSMACQLETLLINQLSTRGFHLTNIADGKHRNFGTSEVLEKEMMAR